MKGKTHILLTALLFVAVRAPAQAGILVDHPRHPFGGSNSDTDFIYFGEPLWQLTVDDFTISTDATVTGITWLGFYGGQFEGSVQPPTGDERMRARFYGSRPGDGLPGPVLYEETFVNPSRAWTGQYVVDSRGHPEYQFGADLNAPFSIFGGSIYWLEIAQVGDQDSEYRWEYSPGDGTPFAYVNPWVPDWQRTTQISNMAFQLIGTPEPSTAALVAFGFFFLKRGAWGKRRQVRAMHS